MINPTTPVAGASGAAQMREAMAQSIGTALSRLGKGGEISDTGLRVLADEALAVARQHIEAAAARELAAIKAEQDEARVLIAHFEGRSEEAVIASREADAAEAELVTLRAELAAVKAERDETIEHSQKLAATIRDMQVSGQSLRASRDALRTALEGADSALKAYEEWEADLILTGDWSGEGVRMDQRQHDAMMKLQENRNAVRSTIRKALTP